MDTLANLGDAIGSRLTPLGVENDGTGLLAIDEQARVFVLDPTAEWFLGNGVDDALETVAGRPDTGPELARTVDGPDWR